MPTYTIQQHATAWAYIEIQAESEEEALKIASDGFLDGWKYETDWLSADFPEVIEVQE